MSLTARLAVVGTTASIIGALLAPRLAAPVAAATVIEPGFQVTTVLSGFDLPTAVAFAPDGRVFIAERAGILKAFDSLSDQTPTTVADLSTNVHASGDRGLLGLAIHPQFPSQPYVYVAYTVDAPPGGTPPFYHDTCPRSPNNVADGCPATARVSRLQVDTDSALVGGEHVLVGGSTWCYQHQAHALDHLAFGPDGALYVSSGDGGSPNYVDYGQHSGHTEASAPANACGDPPSATGEQLTLPTSEGGALRSQDLVTSADPVNAAGSILRIDATTGAARSNNPLVGNGIPGDDRHIAYGLRNPFRFTFRPGTDEIWIGDVGWNEREELDRIPDANDSTVENFGWPCYEGVPRQPGYDGVNLNLCEQLYAAQPSRVTPPFWGYRHSVSPDPVRCGNLGSAISALAFAQGGRYPAPYTNALFVGDYVKGCIWALLPRADGLPDATTVHTIVADAQPVAMSIGPDNRIYYVDIAAGTLSRLDYFADNAPPVVTAVATPPHGPVPLAVAFDASATTDDGPASQLTYTWDLDGDGAYDDATGVTASRTYTASANVDVGLLVRDGAGASATTVIQIQPGNTPPNATIDLPDVGTTWAAGDPIAYAGTVSDEEESLGPSDMTWTVILHHCASPTDCHEHPQQTIAGVASGTFVAPDHEYPARLEFRLEVIDGRGLKDETTVVIDPQTVQLTLLTEPAGLGVVSGGNAYQTPASITSIVGSRLQISAPTPQTLGGTAYAFGSWSDGGAATHDIIVGTRDASFTASFVEAPTTFARGVNLNGAAVTIDGNAWLSHAAALADGLSVGSASLSTSSLTPMPAVDAATRTMLNSGVWQRTGNLRLSHSLPPGDYSIYLWVMENYKSNVRSFNVAIEGATVATGVGQLAKSAWQRYGPYPATVADGALTLDLIRVVGQPHLMGLEIHGE